MVSQSRGQSSGKRERTAAGAEGAADAAGGDDRSAALEKVRDMLAPLGRDEKSRLFDLVSKGGLKHERMERLIARLLVEQLNGARTEHARRLWTGWFDPVLLRDDLTLLTEERLPGSLHIVEAGAWWFALAGAMAPVPGRVQDTIADLARSRPVAHILASAEARDWSEELRQKTLSVLAAARTKPTALNRLITDANAHRARLIKDRGLPVGSVLSPADLDALEAMLRAAPAWRALGKAASSARPDEVTAFTADLVQSEQCDAEGAALFALAHLHSRRDAAFATTIHYAFRLPVFRTALIAHLRFAALLLREAMGARFMGRVTQMQPFVANLDLDDLRARLFGWFEAVHALELDRDERTRMAISEVLGRMIDLVELELVPAVSRQILAMTARSQPQAVIVQVQFVLAFLADVRQRGFAGSPNPWVPDLGVHVADLFRILVTAAAQQREPGRTLPTIARFAQLGDLIGAPIEISAINKALITVIAAALRERDDFDAQEMELIDRVVTKSQDERRRSKWWVSPEVGSLLEIVETRFPGLSSARQ